MQPSHNAEVQREIYRRVVLGDVGWPDVSDLLATYRADFRRRQSCRTGGTETDVATIEQDDLSWLAEANQALKSSSNRFCIVTRVWLVATSQLCNQSPILAPRPVPPHRLVHKIRDASQTGNGQHPPSSVQRACHRFQRSHQLVSAQLRQKVASAVARRFEHNAIVFEQHQLADAENANANSEHLFRLLSK